MPNEVMKSLTIGANTYDLPQKTSDLTNDSGFLTSYTETDPTVPSWAKASSKPTYTASEVGAAASSHTHGNITNSGDITVNAAIANGDRLVINDESASKITNSSITFGTNASQYLSNKGTWQNIPTVPTKTSDLTNDSGFIITESDPVFTASAAHGIASTDITNWNNKISEPASEGTNGQVLMTNGNGTRTWGSVSTADEKVKLTSQSTSGNYPLIFGPTSITSNSTYQGYYNTGVTINPNTKAVTATTFVGALTGTASGNLTSSSTLDASKLSGAIPSAVTATTQTSTDNSTKIATTAFVKTAIDNLPEPMVFKGSLGTGGTITSLPTASTSNTGYTYKVITAGTYASQSAKIGDTFISDGSAWILIPSGDEPSGTVTSITLKATSPISIDSNSAITTSGTRTLSHADSGVTAGTYKSVTVDSKGHVTAGSNPSETDPVFTGSAAYGISSSDITNWNGKTSNTGTVTSVRVQATSPVTSSTSTAQSTTLNTTIALADGYGDTKNPYASKTKNYVLAAPSSANGVPGFRALVADDIPSLTKSKISDFPTIPTKTSQLTNDSNFYSEPTYGIGTADPITKPLVETVRANRLAFLPASQIIIEQTTDGGTTWTDAGVSDATKAGLFAGTRPAVYLPLLNNARSTNCGLRITITAMRYNVPSGTAETAKYNYWNSTYVASQERYCSIDKFWFWIGANGDRLRITVQSATGANPNNWHTKFNTDFGASGWSGSDWVKTSYGAFGGGTNQTGNEWNWRITFFSRMADGASAFTQTSKQAIYQIMAYGENVWGSSNNLMKTDRLYAYDVNQNATFPAKVTATGGFVGSISDVATQGSATNSTARHIWFSDSSTETKRAHNDNFKYTPSTNTITANLSGSATLTGTPTAPTASAGTNNTQIATTAFVKTAIDNADLWEQGVDANDQPVPGAIKAKDYVDSGDVSRTNSAPWTGAFVAGGDNTSTGTYSVMAGIGNTANSFSTTIGDSNTAAGGGGSTLIGNSNQATAGSWGTAFGWGNTISGNNAVALGYNNTSSGDSSFAVGYYNTASEYASTALGCYNTASGYTSTALGYNNTASEYASTALGYNNTSSGDSSFAVGYYNTASEYASTALGYQNTASAYAAYAEGRNTVASGECAHAEGWETEASGNQAHAEGHGTQATARYNHVFGEYNISDTGFTADNARGSYIEIVGNGADEQNRSNARTLDWNGNEWVAGLVSVGSSSTPPTPTANNHLTTKKYVDDIVGNIETLLASI